MQTRKNIRRATLLAMSLLVAATSVFGQAPQKCDVNGDGLINQTDINLIVAALNQPATGPSDPRDADNNGTINALDARTCTTRCTLPGCALGPGNTAPVAANDSYSTPEDTTLVVSAPGVLGNDTDAQNNPLTAAIVTGPASGALVLSGNGSFSYMPPANFSGPVTFTYRANDGALNSNIATVTINVTAVNDRPTALPDTYSTAEDTPLSIAAPGVLANDGDVDGPTLAAQLVAGPVASAGTVTLNGNGSFLFTPAANFTGAATFTYVASDGLLQSSVTTVTVNVTPINDVPVANADSYSTDEDVTLVVAAPGVLGNDSDVEGSSLSAILGTPPATGTLVLSPNGSFTYTPASNFSGTASFTYRASDGVATSSPATVSLTVLSINDLPVAANDSYSTTVGTPLSVAAPGVLANDTDQEGSGLTAVLGTGPANGTLILNANGSFAYTPNPGFTGSNTFTYRANDGTANSNPATVTIAVNPAGNTAPIAFADSYSTPEDTALTVAAPGVLGNDTDAQSNPLTAVLVTPPASGTLNLNANGSFTYTPSANFNGTATFTYQANDGALNSNTATVTISVTPVNDPPVAANDSYSTPEDTQLVVAAPGVLSNDTDPEGTPLSASLVAGPTHGGLTLNANGSFTYTPNANFNGSDSFTYRASDGTLFSNVATVNLTITPVNDPPVAGNDSYSTTAGVTLTVAPPGVLGNDTDIDSSTLTAALVTSPASGTLNLASNGSFTYAPAAGFTGPVTFTYRANDGALNSNIATVTINVTAAPNSPPVAVNDTYSTPEDTALNVAATGVLGNDTDADGNPLTAIQVTGPAQGNLTLNANGSFTYTPPPQFNGQVTFTYRANDGLADSNNVATVTINVTAVNDAPVANVDSYSTPEDTQLVVSAPGVLSNDTDQENNPLTAALVSGPASGSLTLSPAGGFQYTPAANFTGSVSFMYRANDGLLNSNVTTVTINVAPINDAPVANADGYSTNEDTTLNVAAPGVLGNDADVDNNVSTLTAILVTPPATGNLTLNANGSFSYIPQANLSGSPVTFTYRVTDGLLQSTPATVTITVLPINDAPVAQNDSYSASIGTTLNVAVPGVLANDTDQDGGGLTAVLDAGPTKGSLTLNANGSFSYTPNAGASGNDTFTYHAFDGLQGSNIATVTVSLTGGTMTLTVQDPFIAIGGSTQGTITLSTPAPAGGISVQLTSNATGVATVSPATVAIAQGQTTGSFTVNGVGIGNATIGGTAPGYSNGSVGVTVTASVITVGNVTVAPGGQAQFPVTLSAPAPAGGLTVTLTSLNTGIATVPASVVIPAGQSVANPNPMVTGVAPGATTIRGTAPSYAPGAGTATVAIAASFNPNPVVVVEGATAQTTLTLAQPAPAGGITVNLVTAVPARATVASPVTIAVGQSSAQVTVTGVQQGSTVLTATGVGLVATTATINVTPPPAITLPDQTVGKDLQVPVTFSLGAPAPAGNLVVTIGSSNPAKMVVSPNATTAGSTSIQLTVTAGQTSGQFYVQALDSTGVVAAQVTAPGYANGQANITLAPSGLHISSPADFSTGVGSPDTPLRVCAARLSGTTIQTSQQVRGGATVNVAMTSSNTAVGTIVGSPFALTGGNSCTPNSGALAFHPLAFGTSTLTVTQPAGFTMPSTQQSIVATVGAPITVNGTSTIGKDLQRQVTFLLGSPAPAGNLVVTLTSSDPTKLLLSNNGSTAGSTSITVTVPAGQTSGTFFAQSLVNSGAADVTATATGYSAGATTIPFGPSGFRFNTSDFSIGVGDSNQLLSVCPVLLNASNVWQANLALRGGITVNLAITSSNTTVGVIVGSPFAFVGGNGCQNTAAFDPLTKGVSTISLVTPPGFNTPTTSQSVVATVQASITSGGVQIGKNLQASTSVSLGSPAPAGNLVVTITSSDPTRLLVAPNATTAGTASTTITIGAGVSVGSYVAQALDSTGIVNVTLSAPDYTSGTATHTLVPSGFVINQPGSFTTNTLDPNTNIQLCVARLNPTSLTYNGGGTLRFGISPLPLSVTSSNTAVGTIVNASQSLAGNTGCTPLGGAGFQFDPVGAGTSTVAIGPTPSGFSTPGNLQSLVATVTASGINVNAFTVGKNLQQAANGSLQSPAPAGGVAVTLTSADPTRLLLAPNATTAGTASIVVNVAAGTTGFSYTLQALDDTGTVQVTASATGLSSGAGTVTFVPSGFFMNSPSGTFTTNTLDPNTNVQLCAARLNPTSLTYNGGGTLRFGISPVSLSVTSSNTAVGTIVNASQSLAGNTGCTPLGGAGFQFDPVGVGTSTVAIGPAPSGFSTPSNLQSSVATVTASGINVNATTVGKNLQVSATASLQSPAPAGGLAVTLTSADPTRLLLAPNATTAGSAFIVVNVAAGATGLSYTVQGLDDAGTVQVNATAPGFSGGAGVITLHPSGFIIDSPGNFATTTLSLNTNIQVCAARLNPTTLNWATNGTLRFGIAPVNVSMTSSVPAVGTIVNPSLTIAGNASCTLTNTSGFKFDPVAAGTSVLSMGPTPSGFSMPSNFVSITATVTASGINLNTTTLGKDMQATATGSLQAPAPAGGVTITLTSADPAKLLVSPNLTTAGGTTTTVNVAANTTNFSYVVQALNGSVPVQVTASAPGFATGAVNISLVPSGFIIDSPSNFAITAAAANRSIQVCAARLNPTTLNWAANQTLRFGIAAVSVGMTSSNPAAGIIVNSPQLIAGNTSCTVVSAIAGFQFDPLAPGTSVLNLGAVPGFSTPSNSQAITATVN